MKILNDVTVERNDSLSRLKFRFTFFMIIYFILEKKLLNIFFNNLKFFNGIFVDKKFLNRKLKKLIKKKIFIKKFKNHHKIFLTLY